MALANLDKIADAIYYILPRWFNHRHADKAVKHFHHNMHEVAKENGAPLPSENQTRIQELEKELAIYKEIAKDKIDDLWTHFEKGVGRKEGLTHLTIAAQKALPKPKEKALPKPKEQKALPLPKEEKEEEEESPIPKKKWAWGGRLANTQLTPVLPTWLQKKE